MRRILRDPLFHFVVLGAAAFAFYGAVGGDDGGPEIVVDERTVERLASGWVSQWNREPTPDELRGLVEAFLREETLYREALALGLDRDDTIVRRRLAQKMEFLAAAGGGPVAVDDATLEAFLRENPDRFRVPASFAFQQVYLSPDARGAAVERDALEALAALRAGGDPSKLGDRLLLGARHSGVSAPRVDQLFGVGFADALLELPVGEWAGPVPSGYGLHLVRLEAREDARLPALDEVRERVEGEWLAVAREERIEAFHRELRDRYPVRFEVDLAAAR